MLDDTFATVHDHSIFYNDCEYAQVGAEYDPDDGTFSGCRILLPKDRPEDNRLKELYDSASDVAAFSHSERDAIGKKVKATYSFLFKPGSGGIAEYEGDVLWGRPHGEGTAKWEDGTRFTGEFRFGACYSGALTYPDGTMFTG